ncbi:hypothetical protein TNCV_4704911 [Trichonephila clavipes]|nr:hypothetical protein TNCV_4704911 [Trichonephila clavipes]
MGMANQQKTWGRKPRSVHENCNNSNSRREDDEPDEGNGQANALIWSTACATLLQITGSGLDVADRFLDLHAPGASIPWISPSRAT